MNIEIAQNGWTIFIVTSVNGVVNRRTLEPGVWVNGSFVVTDVSDEPEEVKEATANLWTPEVVDAFKAAFPPPPPPPPPDLAPWQFRAMLKLSGKEPALMAFFDALPQQQQIIAKAKLEYTLSFRRNNPLVLAAQQAMGITDAALDALWAQAAALT